MKTNTPTVTQLRKDKHELAQQMTKLIREFEAKHGEDIVNDVYFGRTDNEEVPLEIKVRVEL